MLKGNERGGAEEMRKSGKLNVPCDGFGNLFCQFYLFQLEWQHFTIVLGNDDPAQLEFRFLDRQEVR